MSRRRGDLLEAARAIESFGRGALGQRVAALESAFAGSRATTAASLLEQSGVTRELLGAAYSLKLVAGQVNVLIHAIGILLCLPRLLEKGETVECLSLGAGNTGRAFDLETNVRIAEFKFIHWRRKSNVIRQNALFKDLYGLAEHRTKKRKFPYVLDTTQPLKFLNGNRSLKSVMSRNRRLWEAFEARYRGEYARVAEYYAAKGRTVALTSVAHILVELSATALFKESDDEFAESAI